jgi:hypothetical protein
MFDAIVSRITKTVRKIVRAIGVATCGAPWLSAVAILALFMVVS